MSRNVHIKIKKIIRTPHKESLGRLCASRYFSLVLSVASNIFLPIVASRLIPFTHSGNIRG